MNSLVLCIVVYLGFIVAYRTYGKFLGNKLFELSKDALTPAQELEDGMDYVPAKKDILFGHHFTSIAGTGPPDRQSRPGPRSRPSRLVHAFPAAWSLRSWYSASRLRGDWGNNSRSKL